MFKQQIFKRNAFFKRQSTRQIIPNIIFQIDESTDNGATIAKGNLVTGIKTLELSLFFDPVNPLLSIYRGKVTMIVQQNCSDKNSGLDLMTPR